MILSNTYLVYETSETVSATDHPDFYLPKFISDTEPIPQMWRLDKTGRLRLVRHTSGALLRLLNTAASTTIFSSSDLLQLRIAQILGPVTRVRAGYVKMLLSALSGNLKSLKLDRQGLENKLLIHRIFELDPFSITFRSDLNRILCAIGNLPE